MNKFFKVTILIVSTISVFIALMFNLYGENIDVDDYKEKNINDVAVVFESKREVDSGTCVRFKTHNNSRYYYLIDNAVMKFESDAPQNKEKSNVYIAMECDNSKINYRSSVFGIPPRSEGYMEFIVPNGVSFDKKYFALDSTTVEYNGVFMVDVSFIKGFRIPVEYNSGVWSVNALK